MASSSHKRGGYYGNASYRSREGLSTRPVANSDEIQLHIGPVHGGLDDEISGLQKQVRQLKNQMTLIKAQAGVKNNMRKLNKNIIKSESNNVLHVVLFGLFCVFLVYMWSKISRRRGDAGAGDTSYVATKVSPLAKKSLLILNCVLLSVGNCGGPLIMRLYFIHGGNRVWLTAFLQTSGWPFILVVLVVLYFRRRCNNVANLNSTTAIYMRPRVFFAAAVIGVLTGLDDFFYACGVSRLPVSTTSLIIASQLGFTAVFAFLLVKQKFTPYSINAVVLLTIAAAVLGFHTSSDRPNGESKAEYIKGFFLTMAASVLYGFVLPLVELTYNKAKQAITYTLVLEIQMVVCVFATIFCILGMTINNDFKVIPREVTEYGLGKATYYIVLCINGVLWQCFFLGVIGVVFCASSLLSGVMIAVLLPVTEILAVIIFKEQFQVEKGISLVLSLWGFTSYFYGEYKSMKHEKNEKQSSNDRSAELSQTNYYSV